MWRTSILAVAMLLGASALAYSQQVFPYAPRVNGDASAREGEESVLGEFVETGQHLAVYCYRTRAGFEADSRAPANSPVSTSLVDSGEMVLVAFGTPIRVTRFEELKPPLSGKLAVIELLGGPHQGESLYVRPHKILRHMTKDEVVAERRAPRLPGTRGSPMLKLDVGKLVMLGQIDLKSPLPSVSRSKQTTKPTEYPVLSLPIPAFQRMESFRDYFRAGEGGRRGRSGRLELPVATRVYIVRIIPPDGEIPRAAVVSIAFDGNGETFIIPASCIIEYSSTYLQVPEWTQRRSMPDYSPDTDRNARRTKGKRPARPKQGGVTEDR